MQDGVRFEKGSVIVREIGYRFPLPTRTPCPADAVDVALHACWEVIVDDFTDTCSVVKKMGIRELRALCTFEIHASRHDLGADHDPTFSPSHPTHSIFSLLLRHPCVEAIDIGHPIQHELLCEGGGSWLG